MSELSNRGGETLPEPRLEEVALTRLGYGHCLDKEIALPNGTVVTGRNFLDGYGGSPHKQGTQDMLEAFRSMDPSDELYGATTVYITRFLVPHFGEPVFDDGAT